jgi:hypothetical protein
MRHAKLPVAAAVLVILAGAPLAGHQRASGEGFGLAALGGREAPAYVRLFGPRRLHTGDYRAYVFPLDLEKMLRRLEADPSLVRPPGAWAPAALLPSDAFGQTGGYDRSKIARLYGARRVMVARGPSGAAGGPVQAWTLISPYPDTNLERLEPGTLLIVLTLGGEPGPGSAEPGAHEPGRPARSLVPAPGSLIPRFP